MPHQPVAQFGGYFFLQRFDVGIDKFDHLAGIHVDQVVVVFAVGGLVARASVAKFVFFQYAGFVKKFNGPVDGGQRDARIDGRGPIVEFLHVGMVGGGFQNGDNDTPLVGHAQAMRFAARKDRRCGHANLFADSR